MEKNNGRPVVGQVGLEYLMTYGWALAIVATIVGFLVFLGGTSQETTSCGSFENFLVKGAKADTEKIELVLQNTVGGRVDGLRVYQDIVYDSADSPPLFQINVNYATVGNTTNTAGLSNDYVIDFVEGYKSPLGSGSEKRVIIPWPVDGLAGQEFGADGCDFFTESLGKKFNARITVYYRDRFGLVKEERATCKGIIQEAQEIYFPPESWGC